MKKRMEAVFSMAPRCDTIADIGCDHGKLSAAFLLSGKCRKAIAADISELSLEKARQLSKRLHLQSMECRLGDGLSILAPGEADVIVMAGWGGRNLFEALERERETADGPLIILQPMSETEDLRRLLMRDYLLLDEDLVLEGGRYYDILLARRGKSAAYDDFLCGVGPVLLKKKHPLLKGKLQRRLDLWEQEYETLPARKSVGAAARKTQLAGQMERMREVLACL